MKRNQIIQQESLLESVLEVSNILKQRRPDLNTSITILTDAQTLLSKGSLSDDDLEWIDNAIGYLCHFKCLYDFCPLDLLDEETDQERWQRWGQILDQMRNRANLLCNSVKIRKKNRQNR